MANVPYRKGEEEKITNSGSENQVKQELRFRSENVYRISPRTKRVGKSKRHRKLTIEIG